MMVTHRDVGAAQIACCFSADHLGLGQATAGARYRQNLRVAFRENKEPASVRILKVRGSGRGPVAGRTCMLQLGKVTSFYM